MNAVTTIPQSLPKVSSLRQKPPFLFVEEVVSLDSKQGCIVARLVGENKESFRPAGSPQPYILLEALAQASSLLISTKNHSHRGYIANFESVRFSRPSSQNAPVSLIVEIDEKMHPFYDMKIAAHCNNQVLVEGRMRLYVEI